MGITGLPLKLIQSFLMNRLQRVLLNDHCSAWTPVLTGVPQGLILGPLFFLIYFNDLSEDISSFNKLFADDASNFSVVNDINVFADDTSISSVVSEINVYADQLKIDLEKIPTWAYIFKQAQQVTFSKKNRNFSHHSLYFNKTRVVDCLYQKYLGVHLDKKTKF